MPAVTRRVEVTSSEAAAILEPRRGLVVESVLGPGRFDAVAGPVADYQRDVSVSGSGERVVVTQTVRYRFAVPLVGWLIRAPVRKELCRVGPARVAPWWGPPDALDQGAWAAIAALLTIAIVLGYLGTLLTQTITYAVKEFHLGTGPEGVALAVVRGDIVIALALVALADRRGRRRVVLIGAIVACVLTALGGLAPSLAWLAASQVLARSFVTAATVTAAVMVAEAMPKGARAWAVGVVAMASAIGAGACVIALPIAGLGPRAWRLLFAGSLLGVILVLIAARHLVESARFLRYQSEGRAPVLQRSRLVLLCVANLCLMVFVTPASEFLNEYLRRERHFSPARITLFVLLTVTPGAIGIVVGGRLADTRGRRAVAVGSTAGLTAFTVMGFWVGGWPMWVSSTIATITGAAVTPALSVYNSELFGTGRRGAANGVVTAAGRVGAVIGLLVVGGVASWTGRFGPGFAILAVGPVALVVLVIRSFPETARLSLEELNPEDRPG
jgi:MFS family permease